MFYQLLTFLWLPVYSRAALPLVKWPQLKTCECMCYTQVKVSKSEVWYAHNHTMCCIFISTFSVPAVIHFSLNINLEQYESQKKNSCKNQTGAKGKLPSHSPQIMLGGGSLSSYSKGSTVHREGGLKVLHQSERVLKSWICPFPSPEMWQIQYVSEQIPTGVTKIFVIKVFVCINGYKYWGSTDWNHLGQH